MTKIKSLEVEKWSEPDENGLVRKIGTANAKDTFEALKQHLQNLICCQMSIFSLMGRNID